MNRLVSVAIPTRNRHQYALAAVHAIFAAAPQIEVCISDNSDTDELREHLSDSIGAGSVRYRHSPEPMSFAENFEAAIDLCSGQYVSLIGDDDVIGPRLLEIAQWASDVGIDALTMPQEGRVLHYYWPGSSSPRWRGRLSAALFLSDFTGRTRRVSREKALLDAFLHIGSGPRMLPRIYLGLVSRALIERVRTRWGRLFGSLSPDMYSGVLLALEAERHFELDYPFLLPGACPKSNSITHVTRPTESLASQAHLKHFAEVEWDARIPGFYAAETVWAQTLVDVARLTGRSVPDRGFSYLYAACLLKAPRRLPWVRAAFKANVSDAGRVANIASLAGAVVSRARDRAAAVARAAARMRPGGARFEYRNIEDTSAALACLQRHLEQQQTFPQITEIA
jgi:hypothetical protein